MIVYSICTFACLVFMMTCVDERWISGKRENQWGYKSMLILPRVALYCVAKHVMMKLQYE